jgi:hypothetical protein
MVKVEGFILVDILLRSEPGEEEKLKRDYYG